MPAVSTPDDRRRESPGLQSPIFNFSSPVPITRNWTPVSGASSPATNGLPTRQKSLDAVNGYVVRRESSSASNAGPSRSASDLSQTNRSPSRLSVPGIKLPQGEDATIRRGSVTFVLPSSRESLRLGSPSRLEESDPRCLSPSLPVSRSNSTGSLSPVRRGSLRPASQERLSPSSTKSGSPQRPSLSERRSSFYAAGRTSGKGQNLLDLLPDRLEATSPSDRRRGSSATSLDIPSRQYLRRRRRSRVPDPTPLAVTPGLSTQVNAMDEVSEISLIDRFRRAANTVYVCAVLSKRGNRRTQRETRDPLRNLQTTNDNFGGLAFDPSYFKANRQQRLSEDAKRMLTTKSHLRTERDIKYMQIALKSIQSFAEYPVRMQQKLCKVGWLEAFEPNRCIIRQGHIAHAFYIILSGTVMVTVNDGENSRVVCFLKRGDSFGELAILHKEKRASTVISRDCVELLAISTSDFEDIFMCQGGVKNVNDPDHHEFLESLDFLMDWPMDLLLKHPKECVFNFFGRGDVLVKDSNYSDWIYVVKSGSCCVLKKLRKVKPHLKKRLSGSEQDGTLSLIEAISSQRQNNRSTSSSDKTNGDNSSFGSHGNGTSSSNETSRRDSMSSPVMDSASSRMALRKRRLTSTKGVYLSTTTSLQEKKEKKKKGGKLSVTKKEEEVIPEGFVQQKRTLASDLDNAKRPEERTEADKHPVFVVLQTLEKGGIFGLAPLVFFDQPSLSLVSNGAECIMIRKKFYMEHATEDIRRRLRRQVQPYPADDELQNSLQDYMNWVEYKDQTLNSTVNTVGANRLQRQTFQR